MSSPAPVKKEGWLDKYSRSHYLFGNWRKRYFVLENGQITYYKDLEKTMRKGTMSLEDVTISTETRYQGRNLYLIRGANLYHELDMLIKTPNEEITQEWSKSINEHVAFLKNKKTAVMSQAQAQTTRSQPANPLSPTANVRRRSTMNLAPVGVEVTPSEKVHLWSIILLSIM